MFIYKNLIINYVNKMTIEDINSYIVKNNISITPSEVIIIYNFIKRNYNLILNGNEDCFNDLEKQLSKKTYDKVLELYMQYKNKLLM